MVPANPVLLLALWLLFINPDFARGRELPKRNDLPSSADCTDCTICQYPCHTHSPPPPPSGYPEYGTPPPPPPGSGYPSYEAPPPPPTPPKGNYCPPFSVQCCQYPPPNPYTYIPNQNHSSYSHSSISFFSFFILLISFAVLF